MTSDPRLREAFRDAIGRFASGVTVVTTAVGDRLYGTTVSAISSLSMEPPMLLLCLNQTSETRGAISESNVFAVNVLGEEQGDIAKRFAVKSDSKFDGLTTIASENRVPLIADSLAHIECRVSDTAVGGTHTVFLAEVIKVAAREGGPLTYFRGRFGRFDEARQYEAYRLLRRHILRRVTEAGGQLTALEMATQYGLEPSLAESALVRLWSEGLLTRDETPESYAVTPLSAPFVIEALEARCAIEIAVVERCVPAMTEPDVANLRELAQLANAAVATAPPDFRALSEMSARFHMALVGLSGNRRLIDMYETLGIDAVWRRALGPGEYIDPSYLLALAEACARGDADAAKKLIYGHTDAVKEIVRAALATHGDGV
jgi:4-nitrophenol 2-monooxygenase / 4-nitrocatechol 4-monooxygenase, reductase component